MKKGNFGIKRVGVLLLIILLLMAVLIYVNNIKSGNSKGAYKSLKSIALEGQLEAVDKTSDVCNVDELLVEAAGTVVKARNFKGDTVWSRALVGKVVLMRPSREGLYILDNGKKLYYITKAGKLLWDKQLEGEVNELYIDKNGDLLIDFINTGGAKIKILSSKGIDEGSAMLENSAILAFASGDGENSISILDVASKTIKTKLITFDLKGTMVWSDNFENQIIPMIGYSKDNALLAIGEKTIYKYQGESKKQSKLELNKTIYSADINDSGVVAVVRSRWGFDVMSYDIKLKEIGKFESKTEPKGIIVGAGNYILYYKEKLLICDLKGKARAEYKSIPSINSVHFTGDSNIILTSDRLIQKLNYK